MYRLLVYQLLLLFRSIIFYLQMLNSMVFRLASTAILLSIFSLSSFVLHAQQADDDPILFSVGDNDVHVSEFIYVYEKSNGPSADYSKKSVDEFLELYKKFKLKVADARAQGMEDDPQLESELAQYRDQLANNYMSDAAMLGRLTKELYERMQWDIDVSHILQITDPAATEDEKENVLKILEQAKKALASGVDFSAVAKKYSQDRSVSRNGGHLGYRRAKLPDGFYELETAIYNTPIGEVAGPVHSRLGYHLIKVNGRRPDPGTIEVAHILVRKPMGGVADSSKQVIDMVYEKLKNGADFGEMAQKYSDDKNNRHQNGYLGKFKTGTYDPAFEDAAFAIDADGSFSAPVQTEYGWHIIQRLSLDTLKDYATERRKLEDLVRNDSRYELAQEALIERIKKEENFKKMDVSNEDLLNTLSKGVFRSDWQVPKSYENRDLFQIGDRIFDLEDFIIFLTQNIDARYQRRLMKDPVAEMGNILDRYINHELLEYEKEHLEEKYPEFQEIMREYREGIMLFEISRDKIWDRAGQDTAGLRAFYNQHKENYHTPRTIMYDEFTVNTLNPRVLDKVEKFIKKKNPEKVLKKLNKAAEVVKYQNESVQEEVFEDQFENEGGLQVGSIYKKADKTAGMTIFGKVKEIKPGMPLEFEEARGAVMSDFQKYLEDQWVAELQKKYEIELNDSVLQAIIKS